MVVMRVKGIKRATAKGRVYYYHRATGKRIDAQFGTAEFANEVALLDKHSAGIVQRPESLGALITLYKSSPEYQRLSPRSRQDYNIILDYLKPLHNMPVAQIDAAFILRIRDKAYDARKRRFANYLVQIMSILFSYAVPRGKAKVNVAIGIPKIPRPRDLPKQNRPWSDREVAVFMDGAPLPLRIGVALGLYVGMREGDVVRALRSAYDGNAIQWKQRKTGEDIYLTAPRKLKEELDKSDKGSLYLVSRLDGGPYTQSSFRTMFFNRIRMLRDQGKLGNNLTFHGLRHTAAKNLAEAGCDTRDIAAVLGHKTDNMAKMYADGESKKQRAKAAILKLEDKK
jgi:integrase